MQMEREYANSIYLDDNKDKDKDFLQYRWGSGCTVEITELQVGSERRVGKGRRLVEKLLQRIHGRTHLVYAITRSSNEIAREFYIAVGFEEMVTLKNFYSEGDAVIYGKRIGE